MAMEASSATKGDVNIHTITTMIVSMTLHTL